MSSKTKRFKVALRRVFKVRGRAGKSNTKHVALVDSPGAHTADSEKETASTPVPSSHGIPNLDLLGQPIDLDDVTYFSIETEAPPTRIRQGEDGNLQHGSELDKIPLSSSKPQLRRVNSDPKKIHDASSSHARRASELPAVHSNEGVDDSKQMQTRNSPTGVTELFHLAGRYIPPTMLPGAAASNPVPAGPIRSRSRSGSSEIAASRHTKCVVSKHNHDAQKANEAFLALKKELEKNEFTKAAQIIKQVQSQEGSVVTTSLSQDSTGKPKQEPTAQQHTDTYEIIPTAPSAESNLPSVPTDTIDTILGITPVVSQSDSLDSQGSDYSSYSSFDMESIGEITIDSTTLRLIEMHKAYCDNAKVNENHPARMKKSNMRVSSAYSPIEMAKSHSSVKTEVNRRLTWYDEGENLNKPFTLKTDETFDESLSTRSSRQSFGGIHGSLKMMDHLIPFTRQGLEKLLDSMNCGGVNQEESVMVSTQ